jgi:trimeric autotransporter adhesin
MGLTRTLNRKALKKQAGVVKKARRKAMMEPLEPRLLLSADLSYAMGSGDKDLALELNRINEVDTYQLIDMETGREVASIAAADVGNGIEIIGSDGDDRLVVAASVPLGVQISFIDTTAEDNDVLEFAGGKDRNWYITGEGTGYVDNVQFSGIENLTGAADTEDTFVFSSEGTISGLVEGGDGGFDSIVLDGGTFDTLIYRAFGPDSGTIERDGDVITYSGMEPITDTTTAGNRTIVLNGDVDNIRLRDSSGSLVIESTDDPTTFESITITSPPTGIIDIQSGPDDDTFTIQSLPSAFNNKLKLSGQGGTDTVIASQDADFTLTDTELTFGSVTIALSSIETANLTLSGALNTFSVDGWTGDGQVNGTDIGAFPGSI